MFTYDCLNLHVPLVQNLVPGMRPIQIARSSHHHTKQFGKKKKLDTQAIPSKNDLGVLGVPIFYSKIALLRPTSWKIRTCHKSSKRFSLQNQRAQPLFFCASLLVIFRTTGRYKVGNLTWGDISAELLLGTKQTLKNTKIPVWRGMMWKNFVSPEKPENLQKKIFCRGNSCSTYPVFCEINIICIYLCTWMVAHPQNLYRMRNLQFQPTTTCSLSKVRNL